MKKVAVVQARLGSSRLPCKTLLCLHDLPVIDWIVRRCARSILLDEIVVAMPDAERDNVLAAHVARMGVSVFRGSENDVLDRMHGAAKAAHADVVVRVCADNPLIWGPEIDNLLRFFEATPCDYAYNHIPRNNLYPDGIGAEVVRFDLFERIRNEATAPRHREHCLTCVTDQPEKYRIQTFDPPDARLHRPELKLDMDTVDDFIALARLPLHVGMTPVEVVECIDRQQAEASA